MTLLSLVGTSIYGSSYDHFNNPSGQGDSCWDLDWFFCPITMEGTLLQGSNLLDPTCPLLGTKAIRCKPLLGSDTPKNKSGLIHGLSEKTHLIF